MDVRVASLPPNWTFGQRAEVFIETRHKDDAHTVPESFLVVREERRGVLLDKGGTLAGSRLSPAFVGEASSKSSRA